MQLSRRQFLTLRTTIRPVNMACIDEALCLSSQGIECRSCVDFCSERALRLRTLPGRRSWIDVVATDCIGCGDCIDPCPVQAISLTEDL